MKFDLSGQTAVVTGGARGIGLATARHLAARGCSIVLWDLDFEGFDAAACGFEPALTSVVDVTSPLVIQHSVDQALAETGRIDILVNNAGINGPVADVEQYPTEAWERVLNVNLTSVFHCCRLTLPSMRQRGYGRIVNVASIAGKEGTPGVSAYCASKAGVIGFTKALAREVVKDGITVNAVTPVMAETAILSQMTEAHIDSAKSKIPMGRLATVEEIAATIGWAASPACSFTTGAIFDVSGGRADY
ncbi:SDR family NAD(P)-dependent oxidoreductase [Bosea sp. PAMC 26642]|uniref:SDR family NAD(P)-dependent oxidoreductase n=1 Tax=Bosea sp. (strain PAMC 26642) TaxID=1792307 RepID=UPI0007700439|nr:SDR family NAD(P)-dependent oxidoreductase [Bosea sp. PAMC 26642]AMJ61549.1 3-oxoacyl-ACP reductase [Bosea sp. PAMC 26642]